MGRRKKGDVSTEAPVAVGAEVVLEIETLTNLGVGLGRMETAQTEVTGTKWVVMVPYALPGEQVRVRIWRNHAGHSQADLLACLRASPHRLTPPCPLFGRCGGCQYQHLTYEEQLRWKARQVSEIFLKVAQERVDVLPTKASPQRYGYRTKLTPHHDAPRAGAIPAIGFQEAGRRRLVDVESCAIATPAINHALTALREEARREAMLPSAKRRRGATLLLRDLGEDGVCSDPRQMVSTVVKGVRIRFLAGDFFQNNASVLDGLIDDIASQVLAPGIDTLVDMYCGSGLFALCLASHVREVIGVEVSESAVERAQRNAEENGLNHCRFLAGDAADLFGQIQVDPSRTTVLVDPPRRGCSPSFLEQLGAFAPQRVVYVSCDPATQARDVKVLLTSSGYRIARVQPIDFFPQTRHIENVVTLEFAGAGREAWQPVVRAES